MFRGAFTDVGQEGRGTPSNPGIRSGRQCFQPGEEAAVAAPLKEELQHMQAKVTQLHPPLHDSSQDVKCEIIHDCQ